MSEREELALAIRGAVRVRPFGPNSRAIHDAGGNVSLTSTEAEQAADAVLVWLRAHDDRIRAEALAPVLTLADEWEAGSLPYYFGEGGRRILDDIDLRDLTAALRAAAGTPTPLFGICPDCNVAGGHYPTCPARTPTHHTTEEDGRPASMFQSKFADESWHEEDEGDGETTCAACGAPFDASGDCSRFGKRRHHHTTEEDT